MRHPTMGGGVGGKMTIFCEWFLQFPFAGVYYYRIKAKINLEI